MPTKIEPARPYRPSNGTAGDIFYSKFCANCIGEADGSECEIFTRTLAFDIDDPGYPKEWTYGCDGHPVCTAYRWHDPRIKDGGRRDYLDKKQLTIW